MFDICINKYFSFNIYFSFLPLSYLPILYSKYIVVPFCSTQSRFSPPLFFLYHFFPSFLYLFLPLLSSPCISFFPFFLYLFLRLLSSSSKYSSLLSSSYISSSLLSLSDISLSSPLYSSIYLSSLSLFLTISFFPPLSLLCLFPLLLFPPHGPKSNPNFRDIT